MVKKTYSSFDAAASGLFLTDSTSIAATPIRNLRTSSEAEMNKRVLIAGVHAIISSIHSPFSLLSLVFKPLQCRLLVHSIYLYMRQNILKRSNRFLTAMFCKLAFLKIRFIFRFKWLLFREAWHYQIMLYESISFFNIAKKFLGFS